MVPFGGQSVKAEMAAYFQHNRVSKFIGTRMFHKGTKTKNEIETVWTEKVTITTAEPMPSVLARSLVRAACCVVRCALCGAWCCVLCFVLCAVWCCVLVCAANLRTRG